MAAYYNEIDAHAAEWLRNLIKAGAIAPGDVDERSIEDVHPHELNGYTQCHFFAGIGIWSHALRSAGWTDDRPVWTGSCPCQPFSAAGKGAGLADPRHLWPAWFWLIQQCKPGIVFGEQVAGKAGEAWLDLVQTDLENETYASGAAVTAACGFGAPHQRRRLYFVAHTFSAGLQGRVQAHVRRHEPPREPEPTGGSNPSGMANTDSEPAQRWGGPDRVPVQTGNTVSAAREQRLRNTPTDGSETDVPGPANGFWRMADWLGCTDDKFRPVEPGTFPLADGTPGRVGQLRAYGNGLCAQQAQAFVEAAMQTLQQTQPTQTDPKGGDV